MPSLKWRRASAVASAPVLGLVASLSALGAAAAHRGLAPSRHATERAEMARRRIVLRYHVFMALWCSVAGRMRRVHWHRPWLALALAPARGDAGCSYSVRALLDSARPKAHGSRVIRWERARRSAARWSWF